MHGLTDLLQSSQLLQRPTVRLSALTWQAAVNVTSNRPASNMTCPICQTICSLLLPVDFVYIGSLDIENWSGFIFAAKRGNIDNCPSSVDCDLVKASMKMWSPSAPLWQIDAPSLRSQILARHCFKGHSGCLSENADFDFSQNKNSSLDRLNADVNYLLIKLF